MARINLEQFPESIYREAKHGAVQLGVSLKQYIIMLISKDRGLAIPPAPKSGPKPKEAK